MGTPVAHAYRLTDGLEPKRTTRLVLIRAGLVVVVLAAALVASGHTMALLPFLPRSLGAITLPR
jgi:hypothetical protein